MEIEKWKEIKMLNKQLENLRHLLVWQSKKEEKLIKDFDDKLKIQIKMGWEKGRNFGVLLGTIGTLLIEFLIKIMW